MNLECSSRGDKRFSALYAQVNFGGKTNTIEKHYQNCKKDKGGYTAGKGRKVEYVEIAGFEFPPSILTDFYYALWYLYLSNHPELIEVINHYDTFTDAFRGHCINCQADVIKQVRYEGLESLRKNLDNLYLYIIKEIK